jgi:hypothetical protein
VASVNGNWREFADSKRFHRALQIGRSAFYSPRSAARSRSSGSEKDNPVHSGRRSKQEGIWAVFLSTAPLLYPLKRGWRWLSLQLFKSFNPIIIGVSCFSPCLAEGSAIGPVRLYGF